MNNMASPSHASSQFYQLPMFMKPSEVGRLRSGDYGAHVKDVTPDDMGRAHQDQSDYRGSPDVHTYLDNLEGHVNSQQGIEEPVHVWHSQNGRFLVDGHHRAAVARRTDRLTPVVHHDGDMDKVHQSVFLKGLDLL